MAKTRNKNHSEVDHWRGVCKELEKENKSLKKQVRQFEKYSSNSQDEEIMTESEDTMTDQEFKLKKDCEACGRGKVIQTLEVMGKVYGTCNQCGCHERIR